jgi:hypothetical protein
MATNQTTKSAAQSKAKSRRMPPRADYCDVVTDEHIERIKTLVPEEEYKDGKVICGPAW